MVKNTSKTLRKNLFLLITLLLPLQLFPEGIAQPTIQTVSNICNNYEELKVAFNNQDAKKQIIDSIEQDFIHFMDHITNQALLNLLAVDPTFKTTLRTLYNKHKDQLTNAQKETIKKNIHKKNNAKEFLETSTTLCIGILFFAVIAIAAIFENASKKNKKKKEEKVRNNK